MANHLLVPMRPERLGVDDEEDEVHGLDVRLVAATMSTSQDLSALWYYYLSVLLLIILDFCFSLIYVSLSLCLSMPLSLWWTPKYI